MACNLLGAVWGKFRSWLRNPHCLWPSSPLLEFALPRAVVWSASLSAASSLMESAAPHHCSDTQKWVKTYRECSLIYAPFSHFTQGIWSIWPRPKFRRQTESVWQHWVTGVSMWRSEPCPQTQCLNTTWAKWSKVPCQKDAKLRLLRTRNKTWWWMRRDSPEIVFHGWSFIPASTFCVQWRVA